MPVRWPLNAAAPIQSGHVEQVAMDKNAFYAQYDGPRPAMVFLDAMHDYEHTKIDIDYRLRAVRAGLQFVHIPRCHCLYRKGPPDAATSNMARLQPRHAYVLEKHT